MEFLTVSILFTVVLVSDKKIKSGLDPFIWAFKARTIEAL